MRTYRGGQPLDVGPLLRSHIERLLQTQFDMCCIEADDDGDYRLQHDSVVYYVGLHHFADTWWVRVFCPLVIGVKRTAKLLAELNELNTRSPLTKVVWMDGTVFIGGHLHASAVNPESFGRLCAVVGRLSADVGQMIALVHGGHLVEADASEEETA